MSQGHNHLNHTTWECKYHVVFTPKYRKKVLFGQIRRHLGNLLGASNQGGGPQANLYRTCHPAILGHRGRRLATAQPGVSKPGRSTAGARQII